MRPIGFSSGALAYSDFRRGVSMLLGKDIHSIELSALREHELGPLLDSLDDLDLSQFKYIAIHAPSAFAADAEKSIIARLIATACVREWPVVLHPDAMYDVASWRALHRFLCIENMDKRKAGGRTVSELQRIFEQLPEASLCFDIGHARQVDPTMTESFLILRAFADRLQQVHVSEVNTESKHDPLSVASIFAFQEVADLIPPSVPLILETPVLETELFTEIEKVREALPWRELAPAD